MLPPSFLAVPSVIFFLYMYWLFLFNVMCAFAAAHDGVHVRMLSRESLKKRKEKKQKTKTRENFGEVAQVADKKDD